MRYQDEACEAKNGLRTSGTSFDPISTFLFCNSCKPYSQQQTKNRKWKLLIWDIEHLSFESTYNANYVKKALFWWRTRPGFWDSLLDIVFGVWITPLKQIITSPTYKLSCSFRSLIHGIKCLTKNKGKPLFYTKSGKSKRKLQASQSRCMVNHFQLQASSRINQGLRRGGDRWKMLIAMQFCSIVWT